jgi:hypothetical protein
MVSFGHEEIRGNIIHGRSGVLLFFVAYVISNCRF